MEFEPKGIFIDGRWVESTGTATTELINPARDQVVGHATDATASDVDRVVQSANAARSGEWSRMSLADRIGVIRKVRELMTGRAEELARLQTTTMGAPIRSSRGSMVAAGNLLQSYIDAVEAMDFEFLRQDPWGQALIRREPVRGVVAAIAPWNGPLPVAINKLIPALLVGCAAVIKPAPETPLETSILAELFVEAGGPPGVLNVVTGGRETGEALVVHPLVTKVSFTGSTAAGHRIGALCGERFTRMSLELGGKSAAIVLDDVEISAATPVIAAGNFGNTGQACIALSRVLVPRSRYDEFVDAAVAAAQSHVLGDTFDETTTLGPLVARRQLDRVLGYFDVAQSEGAKIVTGGSQPMHLNHGFFVEPTVLTGVDNSMRIAREEIFGPVMSVIPYDTVDEAVAIANDSEYGLHGGVFTSDLERGLDVARRIETGTITVNSYSTNPSAPFGGVKNSGIGREHGPEGAGAFLETKSYVIPKALFDTLSERGIPQG